MKKKVLFIQSQTLYLKSILPVANQLYKLNYELHFKINNFFYKNFSYEKNLQIISANPTNANIINIEIFNFISNIINLKFNWNIIRNKVKFIYFSRFTKYDLVIGTTKDIPLLIKYKKFSKVCCLGYQHIPFTLFLNLGVKLNLSKNKLNEKNQFTNFHKFHKLFKNYELMENTFTYINEPIKNKFNIKNKKYVLIFHPGGYRNIITKFGENKKKSYDSQINFFIKICKILIANDFIPVIKIHPLCACYHDYEDVSFLLKTSKENKFQNIKIIKRDEPYFEYAFLSKFILTFGSSSLYELWSVGIKNVMICNFFGQERSQKFNFFKSIFLNTYDEYENFINNFNINSIRYDNFTTSIIDSYFQLNKKDSFNKLIDYLDK